ncbi:MAG: murein hydrolase activator EnvC family protein [Alphaproteobacteria bacterium]
MLRYIFLSLIILALTALPQNAHADQLDNAAQQQRLEKIQSEMKSVSQDQKILTIKKSALERSITDVNDELRALSQKIQDAEQERSALTLRINELSQQEEHLNQDLLLRRKEVDKLIMALIRLKKVPPEIMVLQPNSMLSAAQGTMVLSGVLPDIEQKLQSLADDLTKLDKLREEIENKKSETQILLSALSRDQAKLEDLVDKKKTDLYNTNKDLQRRQVTLRKLSREAETVEELMQKITALAAIPKPVYAPRRGAEPPKVTKAPKTEKRSKTTKNIMPAVANAAHPLPPGMPVVGHVDVNYGEIDDLGAKSQGWTISTQKNAIVTSPFSGTVKYTGAFKRYGQILLIQHDADYFTLIGGVAEIYVLPETQITKGTPLARMGQSGDAQGLTHLYYEVRYKGKPVDPKRLLSYKNL